MIHEKPHVSTRDEALRNVDVFKDFTSTIEVEDFLFSCELVGVGTNAIVFLLPPFEKCHESEILFRLEIQNPIGYEWTKKLLEKLVCDYPSFFPKLQRLLQKLDERVKPRSLKTQTAESRKSMKKQIAGHNAAFRRNPLLTMPINSYYTFEGKWLGIRMKYLNGTSLGDAFPDAELTPFARAILKDPNPRNILVGILNSQTNEALIDIWDFTPSDEDLNVEQTDRLYIEPLSHRG